jgi:ribosome-binding protein aMBF1 (putative translation factor)
MKSGWQLALKMGIPTAPVLRWERDSEQPIEQQREQLAYILGFKLGVDLPETTGTEVATAGKNYC